MPAASHTRSPDHAASEFEKFERERRRLAAEIPSDFDRAVEQVKRVATRKNET